MDHRTLTIDKADISLIFDCVYMHVEKNEFIQNLWTTYDPI